jgi:ubiquinone/menaquinone biosynthesis C-methylase UbiE
MFKKKFAMIMVALALFTVVFVLIRRTKRDPMPCPSCLSWMLENPYMDGLAGADSLLERAHVEPGMHVLDVGCGPGRIAVPAAERVGDKGEVVGLDLQEDMLRRVRQKLENRQVKNVRLINAGIGEGQTEPGVFDRAFLVTVLGEIRNKAAAFSEIYRALKPGGILSITEVFPDPHFQSPAAIRRLAQEAGFEVSEKIGSFPAYTMNLVKPA